MVVDKSLFRLLVHDTHHEVTVGLNVQPVAPRKHLFVGRTPARPEEYQLLATQFRHLRGAGKLSCHRCHVNTFENSFKTYLVEILVPTPDGPLPDIIVKVFLLRVGGDLLALVQDDEPDKLFVDCTTLDLSCHPGVLPK